MKKDHEKKSGVTRRVKALFAGAAVAAGLGGIAWLTE
jgi:hypothetical protein